MIFYYSGQFGSQRNLCPELLLKDGATVMLSYFTAKDKGAQNKRFRRLVRSRKKSPKGEPR